MWPTTLSAIALVFVFEGILPFLCPPCWRRTLLKLITLPDRAVRIMGLLSMLFGVVIVYLVNNFYSG